MMPLHVAEKVSP